MRLSTDIRILAALLVLGGCTSGRTPEITWSLMHPTQLDSVYMHRIIEESRSHPVDNFEICGGSNSESAGSLDGLLLYEEWPLAEAAQDRDVVLSNRENLKAIVRMSHEDGKQVYYWHREVLCNKGLVESIPGLLDSSGEFDLLGAPYEELLRYKIRKTFELVPDLDGIVLTLTEASYSSLHNSRPDLYPPVKVVEKIGGIFAEELSARGKRFILRSFGSISEDYDNILAGAQQLARTYDFEVETKITPYDFNPFLPDNPFLKHTPGCKLGAECDVLGEFLGCGRMLPEHVDEIVRYVSYARTKKVDRYTIRLDRKWKSVFDVYPINLYAYEQAILHPEKTGEQIRREYYEGLYPKDVADTLFLMSRDGMECVKKTQFVDGNLIFHWYPTTADLKLLKAGGVLDVFAPEGTSLERSRKQWAMRHFTSTPGRGRIVREKDEAVAIARENLRRLSCIKDSLSAQDAKRLSEGWEVSLSESESIGQMCRVICAYFDDMERRDPSAAGLGAAMKKMHAALDGRDLLRPIPGICERFAEEYPLELALRCRLDAEAMDYVLPGCVCDQYRVEHYMLGSFCEVRGGRPVAVVGNTVYPDCYIAMSLGGCADGPAVVRVCGEGPCRVEVRCGSDAGCGSGTARGSGAECSPGTARGSGEGCGSIVIEADLSEGPAYVGVPASSCEVVIRKGLGASEYPAIESVALLSVDKFVKESLSYALRQEMKMYDKIRPQKGLLPDRTGTDGSFIPAVPAQWTAGFFPGTLWLLYEYSGCDKVKAAAVDMTRRMESEQYNTGTHDIGFMMNCSYGQMRRFLPSAQCDSVLVNSARSLCTRFSPEVGCIRSWNSATDSTEFIVIIDNMMNLELLENAYSITGDKRFEDVAVSHANTTMKNHFRPDYSSYHRVDYDSVTGSVRTRRTAQGYADESSWARGQGWAVYGYTSMYRLTGDAAYLSQAENIARYILADGSLPSDGVVLWDFSIPDAAAAPRDASAAAVISSAFLELSSYVADEALCASLRSYALKALCSLTGPAYRAALGDNECFLLKHSTINLPKGNFDTAVVYADYYYIEALLRLI